MKQLDFDRAFPQTPDCIHAAIEMGFRKGQKKMKMQNKIIMFGSIAAALAIMFAAALATGGLSTAPQPDVLAQPPVTDVPKVQEEPMVWCTEKGNYYHFDEHCSGMEGAIYGTLSYALALDKGPCPVCITNNEEGLAIDDENITVYAAYGKPLYYHKADICNGQQNNRSLTLANAEKEQLIPCPDCYATNISEENAEAAELVFYCTPSGKYYHLEPDCSGMRNAEARTPEQVFINSGYTACPSCIDTDEEKALLMLPVPQDDADEVFIAPSNNYYHRDHGCFYMSMVIKVDLKTAKDMGHTPCPMCFRDQVDISTFETCWATKNGKYYHSEEHCSGMQNAVSGLVEEARSKGKMRCPVCMKTTPENYDLFTTAFGQEIEDLYPGYIYECTNYGFEWNISNGTEIIRLCEVHPQGTAFFGEELPGLPELHLTNIPAKYRIFMSKTPAPIGSMYAAARTEGEKQLQHSKLTIEDLPLQSVIVYFDANRQVNACEMQFGFGDHVKLKWQVNADGAIELTEGEFVDIQWG